MILLLNGPELLIPLLEIASLVIIIPWQSFTAKHYLVEVEGAHQGGRLKKTHVICVSSHNKRVYHKVKYDRPGECSPEKDCLR